MMKINEVAKLTGVTVRTLHYYDRIGLLHPSTVTEAGYRLYDSDKLATLQQILFFRELEFPLDEIRSIMQSKDYTPADALKKHRELLLMRRERLDGLLALLERTTRGETEMSFKEFDMSAIEAQREQYAAEVRERWGNSEAYAESERRTASYSKEQWAQITAEAEEIFKGFAAVRDGAPDSDTAQALVARWQQHITDRYYPCTNEILAGLGKMYTADERFANNIDAHGKGTAAFMSEAIEHYCSK